jgi:hypothetical protein
MTRFSELWKGRLPEHHHCIALFYVVIRHAGVIAKDRYRILKNKLTKIDEVRLQEKADSRRRMTHRREVHSVVFMQSTNVQ